jgi:hypothetical protein
MADNRYTEPELVQHGSVASLTNNLDKIGSADDGVDYDQGDLDGTIQPDS